MDNVNRPVSKGGGEEFPLHLKCFQNIVECKPKGMMSLITMFELYIMCHNEKYIRGLFVFTDSQIISGSPTWKKNPGYGGGGEYMCPSQLDNE